MAERLFCSHSFRYQFGIDSVDSILALAFKRPTVFMSWMFHSCISTYAQNCLKAEGIVK